MQLANNTRCKLHIGVNKCFSSAKDCAYLAHRKRPERRDLNLFVKTALASSVVV